jgi:tRNA-2-methylthio-N6-dimethylallyladenosine synthase
VEIPVESGSNRISKLKGRDYTVDDFKKCIRSIKRAWPPFKIRNQLMVGFPSETLLDFAASMKLIDDLDVDFVEVYQFSPFLGQSQRRWTVISPAK